MTGSGLTDLDGGLQRGNSMVDEFSVGGDESPLRIIKKPLREYRNEPST